MNKERSLFSNSIRFKTEKYVIHTCPVSKLNESKLKLVCTIAILDSVLDKIGPGFIPNIISSLASGNLITGA